MAELSEAQKKKRDEIAESLKADPDFKPREGRTKEESAFAVATERVQTMGNPLDEKAKGHLYSFSTELMNSGDVGLRTHGQRLQIAIDRDDPKKVRSILGDLKKIADEVGDEWAVALIKDLQEMVSDNEKTE